LTLASLVVAVNAAAHIADILINIVTLRGERGRGWRKGWRWRTHHPPAHDALTEMTVTALGGEHPIAAAPAQILVDRLAREILSQLQVGMTLVGGAGAGAGGGGHGHAHTRQILVNVRLHGEVIVDVLRLLWHFHAFFLSISLLSLIAAASCHNSILSEKITAKRETRRDNE